MLKKRALIIFLSVLIAAGATAYFNRVAISDFWAEFKKQPLPKPLTVDDIVVPPKKEPAEEEKTPDGQKTEDGGVICAMNWDPVCGTDGKTYSNKCRAVAAGAGVKHEGECASPEPEKSVSLPDEFNLKIPFASQAPFGNWDLPYKEACEEASMIMVDYFLRNKGLTSGLADGEILKLVEFEKQTLGYFEDTDTETTAKLLRDYFGRENARVIYDVTIEDIKKEVALGHPVIIPAAGRLLGNPYYRFPGPLYHMLVVKGYTKDGKFIANDPGTKRGENFLYPFEQLYDAIHDWNNGDIYNGRKMAIAIGSDYSSSVSINGAEISVEIAETPEAQSAGLSGKASLPENSGMLFVFGEEMTPAFWMKGMLFPIDIIWIGGGKVVDISKNLQPQPGAADAELKIYSPDAAVERVLEVNAGFSDKNGIQIGDVVNFNF